MKVLIAGTGVAGLEALLALEDLAGDRVEVTMIGPGEEFVYRPLLVAEPFGSAEVLTIPLGQVFEHAGAAHVRDSLAKVDPASREVATAGGDRIPYDALVVGLGARPVEAVPGAITFGDGEGRGEFAKALGELGRRGKRRLAFVVPRTATWTIAAYELALLTAAERDTRHLPDVELLVVTHEENPLGLFGAAASRLVASRLEEVGVEIRTSAAVEAFDGAQIGVAEGDSIPADMAVALPALEVPRLPGLPQHRRGFIRTDAAMQVDGLEHVWAVGDVTWFPVKQGGLATQQADVAARAIAARAGAHVPQHPWQPVLRAALITGEAPEFFRRSRAGGSDAASVGRPLWSPATKIAGEYLSPFVAGVLAERTPEKLQDLHPTALPGSDQDRHDRAVALLLAAADADAGMGDFEGAMRWLSLVEHLNIVIPPEYVARRLEWRRQLDPEAADPAAERIDPSFADAATALSDLQRRIGWLREMEHRRGGEMRAHLAQFDEDMKHLRALTRQTRVLDA